METTQPTTYHRVSDTVQNCILVLLVLIVLRLLLYIFGVENTGAAGAIYWMTDIFSMPFLNSVPIIALGKYIVDLPSAVAGFSILIGGTVLSLVVDIARMYKKYKQEEEIILLNG